MTSLYSDDGDNKLSFPKCIAWLEMRGKELFGENFRIYKEDHHLIFKLLVYMIGDANNAARLGISLTRGILLSGPVGVGKSALLTLLRDLQVKENCFVVKSCREVTFEFIQAGYSVILKYSQNSFRDYMPKTYLFDDLGSENNLKYFGNECNVMAEILLSRYDLFVSKKMISHITTNLNSEEIDEIYGPRVRSRMREMFNLLSFDNTTRDRRR